ncbi:MAG: HAD hydrolase-like protein [Hyphomicrobiaceae bacterium]|nr:HAD hydrolase-like protein [Hyphomicrobiaceae bacterium]
MDLPQDIVLSIRSIAPTIVFDLDGCLVHSSPDIALALNTTLASHGAQFSLRDVERMVGDGLSALFDKAVAASALSLDDAEHHALSTAFRERYAAAPSANSHPREFVATAARTLGRSGARLAVCTNKVEPIALAMMDTLGLTPAFDAIIGHVPDRPKKPAAEPLALAVELAGGRLGNAVMVGDSKADLGAARSAGIPCVLVTGGYGPDSARSLGADFIAEDLEELIAAILVATGCVEDP